jgi:acid phosphatase
VSTGCGGHILVAMIGPQVKAGYKSTTNYHHQSVLRTVLEAMGTTANFPAAANTAPDMREFFLGNAGGTVPPTTVPVVQVSSPTSSTVTGPSVSLAANATAPNPITFMRIYVDNVSVASASANKIAATVSMSKATHSVVFQAWDSTGNVYKTAKTITVQ